MQNFRPHAYRNLTFNTPLSEKRAADLIRGCSPASQIVDLGCGWGELLLRLLKANPEAIGIGVDTDVDVLDRGKRLAQERGLTSRVRFLNKDALKVTGSYDLVVAIGATHIWGHEPAMLRSLKKLLVPNGKILLGSGVYRSQPPLAIKEIFGELPSFSLLQEIVQREGFAINTAECTTLEEWDAFELNWRKGLIESYDPELQTFAIERKIEYENGYREVLDFCYVIATSD